MSLNLRCYCRQSIGALAYKQCKFGCISVDLKILLIRVQINSHMIHFQIQKVTKTKEVHAKAPLYIFFYSLKEMFGFCKSVKLRRVKKKICKITLFNQCRFIRILLMVARCPTKWSGDFMTSSNDAFRRFADFKSSAFFLKLTVEQYFKSIPNKNNSQESPFLHFFSVWS